MAKRTVYNNLNRGEVSDSAVCRDDGERKHQQRCDQQATQDHLIGKDSPGPSRQTEIASEGHVVVSAAGIDCLVLGNEAQAAAAATKWSLVLAAKCHSFP